MAFIHIVKQRHVPVGAAEQGVADLAKVAPALFVLAALGQLATEVKRIDEGVEVGAVVADRRKVDLLAADGIAQ